VIVLYGLPVGLLLGVLLGGRLSGIGDLRFRWAAGAVAGFAIQGVLFTPEVTSRIGDLGPLVYVASTTLVLAAVLANLRIRGMVLVAAGATSNLAAILANGGFMPAHAGAYAEVGRVIGEGYTNVKHVPEPALAALTDVIPLPAWLPFASVVSIGDLLIMAGIAAVLAFAMRGARRPAPPATGVVLDPGT
jgi:hypothetical protein